MSRTLPPEAQVRRGLIVLAVVFLAPVIIYVASIVLFAIAMGSADPFPAFMADYQAMRNGTDQAAERAFPVFIARTFPIGSDKNDAIARMRKGGFKITKSTPEAVGLLWGRHAGPCSEQYSVVINSDANGKIAGIAGRLSTTCL